MVHCIFFYISNALYGHHSLNVLYSSFIYRLKTTIQQQISNNLHDTIDLKCQKPKKKLPEIGES